MACKNCNDTGQATYFSELAWEFEKRDCHLCRKKREKEKRNALPSQ